METTLKPVAVSAGEGEALWWLDCLAVIKVTSEDTGQMTIVEITEGPGAQAPWHVHYREDEAFWILEGDVLIEVGDTKIDAHAGDYAFGPRNIPHRYTVGDAGVRMLFLMTPGGFEDLVRAMSRPADSLTLPPDGPEPDWAMVAAVAKPTAASSWVSIGSRRRSGLNSDNAGTYPALRERRCKDEA
jgi:quercetin dioxygenase-like cupin family protein